MPYSVTHGFAQNDPPGRSWQTPACNPLHEQTSFWREELFPCEIDDSHPPLPWRRPPPMERSPQMPLITVEIGLPANPSSHIINACITRSHAQYLPGTYSQLDILRLHYLDFVTTHLPIDLHDPARNQGSPQWGNAQ